MFELYFNTGTSSVFVGPASIAIDSSNSFALVADLDGCRIFKVNINTAQVSVLAGSGQCLSSDGDGVGASFHRPLDVAIHPAQSYALVIDHSGNKIRRVDITSRRVSTIAGGGTSLTGVGTHAQVRFDH
jgi:DNA-binding beta-propeller fold protein YncE